MHIHLKMGIKTAGFQFYHVHMAGYYGVLAHGVNGINLQKGNIWLVRSHESLLSIKKDMH